MGREVNLGFLALWESVWGSAKPVSILKPAATFGGCGALEFVYVYGALCAHKAYEPVMKRSFLRLGTSSWRGLLGEAREAWERGPPSGASPAALNQHPGYGPERTTSRQDFIPLCDVHQKTGNHSLCREWT